MSLKFAVLDSGTGGIPYMQYIKQVCPDSYCLYLADTLRFPYGTKTKAQVAQSAGECVSLILSNWSPDAIVIACNTISVTALDDLRAKFPGIPIVGTVPAIKLAASLSKTKIIGLLATEGTIKNPYIDYLKNNFASDCKLILRADTPLVDFVEHKFFVSTEEECINAIKPACDFFISNGCDEIILGCTHFVHLRRIFEKYTKGKAHIVDSREGVAKQALKVACEKNAKCEKKAAGDNFLSVLADFLEPRPNKKCSVENLPADQSLFVTGFTGEDLTEKYKSLCNQLNIPWGGILNNLY